MWPTDHVVLKVTLGHEVEGEVNEFALFKALQELHDAVVAFKPFVQSHLGQQTQVGQFDVFENRLNDYFLLCRFVLRAQHGRLVKFHVLFGQILVQRAFEALRADDVLVAAAPTPLGNKKDQQLLAGSELDFERLKRASALCLARPARQRLCFLGV